MRITNNTLTRNYLNNVSKNMQKMQKYQDQLSTEKEVSKSSDNPMAFSTIMRLKNSINENKNYKESIDSSMSWIDTADDALGSVGDVLQNVRELVLKGASDTMTDADRAALAEQVKSYAEEIVQCLNTNYDGRHMFGGQATNEKPFAIDSGGKIMYSGDTNNISHEISPGVDVTLITNGLQITTAEGAKAENKSLGNLLLNISSALKNGDTKALSGSLLDDVDAHVDNITGIRAKMGAIYKRLEAAGERNEAENQSLTKLLSASEDIDFAEKTMQYSSMQTVYEASLKVGAKILQSSLLDYL